MRTETQDGGDAGAFDYTDATSTFGDRLVLAREAAGLGRQQLARRMGVTGPTVRSWEDDQAEPRANRMQMLAGMLNVSMVWLMSGQGTPPRSAGAPASDQRAAEACLADLQRLRAEQMRLAERLARLERRLTAVIG
jgi:HTH-type transcriptional regulator, cell division transcriptional repressor